jgi:hypothetical protein
MSWQLEVFKTSSHVYICLDDNAYEKKVQNVIVCVYVYIHIHVWASTCACIMERSM